MNLTTKGVRHLSMESFTIDLHSSASGNIFQTNSSASFPNLLTTTFEWGMGSSCD